MKKCARACPCTQVKIRKWLETAYDCSRPFSLSFSLSLSCVTAHDAWFEWRHFVKCWWQSLCPRWWNGRIKSWRWISWCNNWHWLWSSHCGGRRLLMVLIPVHELLDTAPVVMIQINGKQQAKYNQQCRQNDNDCAQVSWWTVVDWLFECFHIRWWRCFRCVRDFGTLCWLRSWTNWTKWWGGSMFTWRREFLLEMLEKGLKLKIWILPIDTSAQARKFSWAPLLVEWREMTKDRKKWKSEICVILLKRIKLNLPSNSTGSIFAHSPIVASNVLPLEYTVATLQTWWKKKLFWFFNGKKSYSARQNVAEFTSQVLIHNITCGKTRFDIIDSATISRIESSFQVIWHWNAWSSAEQFQHVFVQTWLFCSYIRAHTEFKVAVEFMKWRDHWKILVIFKYFSTFLIFFSLKKTQKKMDSTREENLPHVTGCQFYTNCDVRTWVVFSYNDSLPIFAAMFIWSWFWHVPRVTWGDIESQIIYNLIRNFVLEKLD